MKQLTATEARVLRARYAASRGCTPEVLAQRLGVTLGEVREAEKTALRKIDPEGAADGIGAGLNTLESAVLRHCIAPAATPTPEALAEQLGITLGEVLEAIKTGMSKLEDPGHATPDTLAALDVAAPSR